MSVLRAVARSGINSWRWECKWQAWVIVVRSFWKTIEYWVRLEQMGKPREMKGMIDYAKQWYHVEEGIIVNWEESKSERVDCFGLMMIEEGVKAYCEIIDCVLNWRAGVELNKRGTVIINGIDRWWVKGCFRLKLKTCGCRILMGWSTFLIRLRFCDWLKNSNMYCSEVMLYTLLVIEIIAWLNE